MTYEIIKCKTIEDYNIDGGKKMCLNELDSDTFEKLKKETKEKKYPCYVKFIDISGSKYTLMQDQHDAGYPPDRNRSDRGRQRMVPGNCRQERFRHLSARDRHPFSQPGRRDHKEELDPGI